MPWRRLGALARKPWRSGSLEKFQSWRLADVDRCQGFIVRNFTSYGDEAFLVGPRLPRTKAVWAKAAAVLRGRAEKRGARGRCEDPVDAAGPQGRLHRPRQRSHRRPADRPAVQAGDIPVWRPAHGRGRPEGRRFRSRSAGARGLHEVPQDAQRRRLRRLYARNHEMPQVGHHYRAARRLWPRPHHRRLPARRTLRRRPADRGQAGRARADQRHVADR